jgi:hypothetical protein
MTRVQRNFFKSQYLELSEQVTEEFLRRAGVVLGEDLGLTRHRSKPRTRFPASAIRKLAGG